MVIGQAVPMKISLRGDEVYESQPELLTVGKPLLVVEIGIQ